MSDGHLLALVGALGILGSVIYGLLQVVKAAIPKAKRKTTLGQVTLKAAPLVLGCALCLVPGLLEGLAALLGLYLPVMTTSAQSLVGLLAGTWSHSLHSILRRRVRNTLEGVDG